jgi:hypothetical protein
MKNTLGRVAHSSVSKDRTADALQTVDARLHIRSLGDPRQDGPVNKRNLSTGENGEFGGEAALGGQRTGFAKCAAPRSE